jgi:hypothetical protein
MEWKSDSEALLDNIASPLKSTSQAHVAPLAVKTALRSRLRLSQALYAVLALLLGSYAIPAAGQTAAPRVAPQPIGTMSDLMVKIIYPASDAVFYITTRTPTTDAEWTELQGKTLMVAESANLLMLPAHMRDEDRWLADAKLMRDAGAAAYKAAQAKDVKALEDLNDALYQSCVTCHMHYRRNYGRR